MLGFATGTELRLAVWAAVALTVAGSLLWGKYEDERANGIIAKDQAARSAQDMRDLQLAQDTINGLRKQLGALTGAAPAVVSQPAPRIRVCVPTGNVRPEVAAGGAQPGQPADSGFDRGVLPGDSGSVGGAAGDVGPGVQDIARAGVLLAIYRVQLLGWSVKQAQPAK